MLLLAAAGALAVVVSTAAPASACSCVGGGDAAHLERSDVVFAGEVLDRSRADSQIEYLFAVDRVFKGEAPSTAEVSTADQGTACGLTDLQDGVTYLVYAHGGDGALGTSSCSGTRTVSAVNLDEVEAVLGRGGPPTSAPAPTAASDATLGATSLADRGPALALVGGGAAAVIVAGLLIGRRRLV